jgi:hypothetical protein
MSNKVIEYLASHKHKAGVTAPYYCEAGDYLLYFISDVDCYADRVDEVLTLFFDMTNKDRIVGLKIKSIRHLCDNLGYRIDDADGS